MIGRPALLAVCLAACTVQPSAAPPQGGSPEGQPAAAAGEPLGCPQIFSCVETCSDKACEDACLARATPEARDRAGAVTTCMTGSGCGSDQACLQEKCSTVLVACAQAPAAVAAAPTAAPTTAPATAAPAGSPIVGHWERSASSPTSNLATNAGYAKSAYDFAADGTYTFRSERWFGHMRSNEWHLVSEQGTYAVAGDKLTVAPRAATGVVKDGAGAVVKTFTVPLENVTYGWQTQFFEGIGETQLVLSPGTETQRDGSFGGNSAFPSSYLLSSNRQIEWKF